MRVSSCLGLSQHDTDTLFYVMLVTMLCITVHVTIEVYDQLDSNNNFLYFMLFNQFSNFALYFLGFLSGILIARVTLKENTESLKSEAMKGTDDPLQVI